MLTHTKDVPVLTAPADLYVTKCTNLWLFAPAVSSFCQ